MQRCDYVPLYGKFEKINLGISFTFLQAITRSEITAVINRILTSSKMANQPAPFSDLKMKREIKVDFKP